MFRIILQSIINLIKIVATLYVVFALITLIFFQHPRDYGAIAQYTSFLIGFIIYFVKIKKKPVLYHQEAYEDAYKLLLEGAFVDDKTNYQKLIKSVDLILYRKYKAAHKLLETLEFDCVRSKDYVAVYGFRALCYDNAKNYKEAITYYRKVLDYDMSLSIIWNNLGLCYFHMQEVKECLDALSNAITYDASNISAYANMTHFFLTYGQPEVALHYVKKGLEVSPNDKNILCWAALAYTKLGDEDNAKLYSDLYIKNGGSKSDIRLMNKLHAKSN